MFSSIYGIIKKDDFEREGVDFMSSSVSDDMTAEITCPACGKKFIINTAQLGEMALCPHCNTIMTARLDSDGPGDFEE